ncbi:MAG: preprotein translocase subunit SecG [Pseudomonadota bacterium]
MQNVVLIIHLFLAIALIGIVLLQRSEGGGLGMGGGGGGGGGVMSSRGAATALGKATWILAIAFICTSIGLTILNAADTAGSSVLDQLAPAADGAATGADVLPPSLEEDGSLLPVAE